MCFSLAELLIPEKGFVGLCAPISVCVCVCVCRMMGGCSFKEDPLKALFLTFPLPIDPLSDFQENWPSFSLVFYMIFIFNDAPSCLFIQQ